MLFLSKRLRRQLITVSSCGITNFGFGLGFGWVTPALQHLQSDASTFRITDKDISWVASMYFAFEVITSLVSCLFLTYKYIGRKPLITFSTFLQAVSWAMLIFAKSATGVILSKAILGVAAGIFDITWSIYVGEIITPSERGIFGSAMILLVIGGQMVEFMLSLVVDHVYLSVIPCAISVLSLGMCFFMVESPILLITRDENAAAIANLAWLRGQDDIKEVQLEFDEMKNYIDRVQHQNNVFIKVIMYPGAHIVYIFCVMIFALAQLTGYMAVVSYLMKIMDQYEQVIDVKYFATIFGVLMFLSVCVNTFLIETIGRRTLLLVGFIACGIILILSAVVFYCQEHYGLNSKFIMIIVAVLLNAYGIFFTACILPTIFVLKSELFPQKLKTIGSVSATISNAIAEFLVTKLFVSVWQCHGLYVNFVSYAVFDIFSIIYVYILISETRGKSLVQIQRDLDKGGKKGTSSSPSPTRTSRLSDGY